MSFFDSGVFTARLFFPVDDDRPPPQDAEDIMIEVESEIRLHVRIHPMDKPRCAVIVFHGNGELVADYDAFALKYREAGAMLAVVEYRGYGQSDGFPTLRLVIRDAPKVVESLVPMLSKQGRIPVVVLGRSLGSACAVEVGNVGVEGVRGLVLESGFGDIEAFVSRRGFRNPLSEEDLEAFCPLGKLKRTSLPLLVMHGQEDRLIDPREARMLFDASAATDKKLEYIPGHGHNDVLHASAYWRVLKSFLHEVAR